MPRLELYAFEYYDELRKRWLLARYRAEKTEIAERYKQFRIVGEPEIRNVADDLADRMPHGPSTCSNKQTDTDA